MRPLDSEDGSLAPLIFGYFIILISLVMIIMNVSMIYIARRELISITEAALVSGAQALNESAYYLGTTSFSARIPLDCGESLRRFHREIPGGVKVISFGCDGTQLSATVSEIEPLPFPLRFLSITEFTNTIHATVLSEYEG